ncbi:MAG: hypothetical protein ACOYMD_11840 [Paludibacter sp.]
MTPELKISFLDKVKRPKTSNKFIDGLLTVITILFYPIILLIGLFVMLLAGLLSLWQRLTIRNEVSQETKLNTVKTANNDKEWQVFTSTDYFLIEQKIAGTLPWDSGDYLYLRSNPTISYLTDNIFGDWLLIDFRGVFLQKWNDTQEINCDLAFIDFDTLNVSVLQKNLPTKHWTTEKINADEIKFTFTTSDNDLTYIVSRTEVNKKNLVQPDM